VNDIRFIIMLDILTRVRVVDTVLAADTVHMVAAAYKILQQKVTYNFILIWLQCRRQNSFTGRASGIFSSVMLNV